MQTTNADLLRLFPSAPAPLAYMPVQINQAQRFVDCDGTLEKINISFPSSCWTDDERAAVFKERWWLASGETDFR